MEARQNGAAGVSDLDALDASDAGEIGRRRPARRGRSLGAASRRPGREQRESGARIAVAESDRHQLFLSADGSRRPAHAVFFSIGPAHVRNEKHVLSSKIRYFIMPHVSTTRTDSLCYYATCILVWMGVKKIIREPVYAHASIREGHN
jgi:hypothetical protein